MTFHEGKVWDDRVSVERLTATVIQIANSIEIPAATIEHLKVGRIEDYIADRLIYGVKSYILGDGEETVHCDERWPADWIEAIKERFLPKWALNRWPIVYTHHRREQTFYRRMCPHISIPLHQGNKIHFEFLRGDQ